MRLLHIIPRAPLALCGVGDYTGLLAQVMRDDYGIKSSILAAGHEVINAKEVGTKIRLAASDADAVTVQYSCYGFQKRGVPVHLIRSIKQLKQSRPNLPILTMFHELAAKGRVTSSAFWLRWLQLRLIADLGGASTAVRTNRASYKKQIEALAPIHFGKTVAMPVFSNLGEMHETFSIEQRSKSLLLFQPPSYGDRSAKAFWEAWEKLCQLLNISQTLVAGRVKALPNGKFEMLGILDGGAAARLLSKCAWGLFDYYPGYIGKSGIFAAFAAHGLCVFTPGDIVGRDEGLVGGTHYLPVKYMSTPPSPDECQAAADRLHAWYQSHSQRVTAASYLEQLAR